MLRLIGRSPFETLR